MIKVKKLIVPSIYVTAVTIIIASIVLVTTSINKYLTIPRDYNYSIQTEFENTLPVVDVENTIIKPYLSENVTVGKYFYDFEADEERQRSSCQRTGSPWR